MGFIALYESNINASYDDIKEYINPTQIDSDTITCLGYEFKVKATIYKNAVADEVINGWHLIFKTERNEPIKRAYSEIEIVNETNMRNRYNSFLYPILELLKLCFWCFKCSNMKGFDMKYKEIIGQIRGKSILISKFATASESSNAYSNLLDSTRDFYSEFMFAFILNQHKNGIEFDKKSDFVLNGYTGQVKTIHDKKIYSIIEEKELVAYLKNKEDESTEEIKEFLSNEIHDLRWKYHIKNAIERNADIIFVNATQSLNQQASIFIHQHQMQKENENLLEHLPGYEINMIKVLVILECIYKEFITTFFLFKVPILQNGIKLKLDEVKFTKNFIKNTLNLN